MSEDVRDVPGHDSEDGHGGVSTEAAAHALLQLVGDRPATVGRLRAARIIGGYAISGMGAEESAELMAYAVMTGWSLRDTVQLVDALIDGGLMCTSIGARPTLVLTRAGHRALEALEGYATAAERLSG